MNRHLRFLSFTFIVVLSSHCARTSRLTGDAPGGSGSSGADVTVSMASPSGGSSGVSVGTPTNGANVGTSFALRATSTSCQGQPVATMAYSFGSGADSPAVDGTSLDTEVTGAPAGSQILHVKSWGNKGAGCDTDITLDVVASGVTVTTPSTGANVGTTFTLQAASVSCQGQPVATMAYSVGNGADSPAVDGTSLDTQVTLSPGNAQVLHVKSWGDQGAGCDADITLNVIASGVTVATPSNGADVGTTFTLEATSAGCQGQPVATMAYSIGNGADSPAINGTSLNAQVTASPGNGQVLHVKSWGNQGAGCDTDVTLNVTASSSSSSSSGGFDGSSNIPNPPSSATHYTDIQELSDWKSSTGAASQCPGGVPSSKCDPVNANYNSTVEHPADPISLAGSEGETGLFQLYSSPAWATVVWGHSAGTQTSVRNLIWDFYVDVTGTNYNASELDLYDSLNGGQRFMMGSQCDRGHNTWDTWNEATQHWFQNASVPCNSVLPPNQWNHVTFYNTLDSSNNTYTYHVLRINGVDYVLNQSFGTAPVGWPDGLIGMQVQLDANGSGSGVNEYLENVQIYGW